MFVLCKQRGKLFWKPLLTSSKQDTCSIYLVHKIKRNRKENCKLNDKDFEIFWFVKKSIAASMARKITQRCVTLGYDLNLCRSQISL